ncbi:Uncharacterized protein PBTT_00073 [Plasmodiophora brassicae]
MASLFMQLMMYLPMLVIATSAVDAADVAPLKWTQKVRVEEYKRFEPHMWIMIGVPVAIVTALFTMCCSCRCCCRVKNSN